MAALLSIDNRRHDTERRQDERDIRRREHSERPLGTLTPTGPSGKARARQRYRADRSEPFGAGHKTASGNWQTDGDRHSGHREDRQRQVSQAPSEVGAALGPPEHKTGGEHSQRRIGGRDIAGQFGAGQGEQANPHPSPAQQEDSVRSQPMGRSTFTHKVDGERDREHGPRKEPDRNRHWVEPSTTAMTFETAHRPRDVVLPKKSCQELAVGPHTDPHVPRRGDGKDHRDSGQRPKRPAGAEEMSSRKRRGAASGATSQPRPPAGRRCGAVRRQLGPSRDQQKHTDHSRRQDGPNRTFGQHSQPHRRVHAERRGQPQRRSPIASRRR